MRMTIIPLALATLPATLHAKPIELSCLVQTSSSQPANAQHKDVKAGERYRFEFDTQGGTAEVQRTWRDSDGNEMKREWTAPVTLTPSRAVFAFDVDYGHGITAQHRYDIDRAKLTFTGTEAVSEAITGGMVSNFAGRCELSEVAARNNKF